MKNASDKLFSLLLIFIFILGLSACGGGSSDTPSTTPPAAPVDLWTWASGSDVVNQPGVYGTKGTADAANVPGARGHSVSWTDSSGSLWLFGGSNYSWYYNDLWKYDGTNWTWVSGSNSPFGNQAGDYGTLGNAANTNVPGARKGAVSWTDSSGNLWLFGGYGFDSNGVLGELNDLWKFDGTNWTWVSGSSVIGQVGHYGTQGTAADTNVPGARFGSVSWTDSSGSLWLYGGYSFTTGFRNDLWCYDGSNWIWVSGSSTANQSGVYSGTLADNVPGAREGAISWTDSSDNLWLFGGYGFDSNGQGGYLNDLWKYDGSNWTWAGGSDIRNQVGVYGTRGVADANNMPGARFYSVGWADSSGNFWLIGRPNIEMDLAFNDLWKYDGTNWTWMSGSNSGGQSGDYGTQGTAADSNVPGARGYSISWTDGSGNLWLFGGTGYDSTGMLNYLNDLWRYQP